MLWFSVQAANKIHHPKDGYGFVPELRAGGYDRWLENWELPDDCGIVIDRALGVSKTAYDNGTYVVPFCRARSTIYDLFDAVDERTMLFVGAPPRTLTDDEFLYELQWALRLETVCYDTAIEDNVIFDVLKRRGIRVLREPSFPGIAEGRLSAYDRAFPSEVVWMTQSDVNVRFAAAKKRLLEGKETVVAFRGLTKAMVDELRSCR